MIELNIISPRFEIADWAACQWNDTRADGKDHKKKRCASGIHVSLSFPSIKSISTPNRMQALLRWLLDGHWNSLFVA
jgi:hypothetical protein